MKNKKAKNYGLLILGLIISIGTYNALVINTDSTLGHSSSKNFKRLDETLGEVVAGRNPAVTQWKKIEPMAPIAQARNEIEQRKIHNTSAPVLNLPTKTQAAIEKSLDLKLVEVINPAKWSNIQEQGFSGSIKASEGIIENLTATLPNGGSLDISFIEMSGNTFEYDFQGEVYSALIYQVDQSAYMVTMTNGPLEGTRMRFSSNDTTTDDHNEVAINHNNEVINEVATDFEVAAFNFNQI
jgi:hypothetical protein